MTEMDEMEPRAGNGSRHGVSFDTEEMISKTRSALREQLDHQPYLVLGLSAALGYVLAAGMPRPVASYLLRYGIRSGLRSGLRSVLGSVLPHHEEMEE